MEEVELKPGGSDIDVTESNKKEYVGWVLTTCIDSCIEFSALGRAKIYVKALKLHLLGDQKELLGSKISSTTNCVTFISVLVFLCL